MQAVLNYTTTAATLLGHFTFRLADKVTSAPCCRTCVHCGAVKLPAQCGVEQQGMVLCASGAKGPFKRLVCCLLQMGGAEGVRAAEIGNLTLQLHGGLHMHCVPRATLQ